MKTNILTFALIAIFSLSACSEEHVVKNNNSNVLFTHQITGDSTFFPLNIGNKWIYRMIMFSDTTELTTEITGIESINSTDYFVVKSNTGCFNCNNIGVQSISYIRRNDYKTFLKLMDNLEYPYRCFTDTSISFDNCPELIQTYMEIRDSITVPAGIFNSILLTEGSGSEPFQYYYAKGAGMIKKFWMKGYMELIYAEINGKTIGVLK